MAGPVVLAAIVGGKRLRIVAALSARFGNLDLAEDAFSEACARGAALTEAPRDWAAWLYTAAARIALDELRHTKVVREHRLTGAETEEGEMGETELIPDRRLALIFACCHPAIDVVSRVTLALSTICGFTAEQVARASLLSPAAVSQRLVRAKRKLAGGGIVFEIPDPRFYGERLEAVLTTLEIAYSRAHSSSATEGSDPLLARQVLEFARLLIELLPDEAEVLALAATLHFSEARRGARTDADGAMIPLAEQDPGLWNGDLLDAARHCRSRIGLDNELTPRLIQLELQHAWCARKTAEETPPWPRILQLYDRLLELDDNAFARLNRIVALERVEGAASAWAEFETLPAGQLENVPAYHAVKADLLASRGILAAARAAYDAAITLQESDAEIRWLTAKRNELA